MYQVFISGYHLTSVTHGKPYYVYVVETTNSNNGVRHLIEKRYSEFSTLHRMVIFFWDRIFGLVDHQSCPFNVLLLTVYSFTVEERKSYNAISSKASEKF